MKKISKSPGVKKISHPIPFFHLILTQNPQGFISIIALGIFALLVIFGILVQLIVVDTFKSVRNSDNYLSSKLIADSMVEFLQYELNKHEAGYNLPFNGTNNKISCQFQNGQSVRVGGNTPHTFCNELTNLVANAGDVAVTMEVKGRAESGENIRTASCGGSFGGINTNDCFVVPFPAAGSAGDRCGFYTPVLGQSGNNDIPLTITGVSTLPQGASLDQLEYSCNWNKLTFGSGSLDRVAIPLYYEGANGTIVNPFFGANAAAQNLILRLRAPCKPCSVNGGGDTRICTANQDPTFCAPSERYRLDTGVANIDDDIVVQWQIKGTCNNASGQPQQCAIVGDPSKNSSSSLQLLSVIQESTINNSQNINALDSLVQGLDVTVFPPAEVFILDNSRNSAKLQTYQKPVLTIFLSESLISNLGSNVPYLEYQLLTDEPVSNPSTKLEIMISVNGNVFKKTLNKEQKKALIDFAIQN